MGEFAEVRLSEFMIDHLEMESTSILRDSEEGQAQLEKERMLRGACAKTKKMSTIQEKEKENEGEDEKEKMEEEEMEQEKKKKKKGKGRQDCAQMGKIEASCHLVPSPISCCCSDNQNLSPAL